jgi:sec-independent protein translocase protein TatA
MPTPGPLELVIILVIALIILGPGKLPDVGASLGKSIREFRKASSDIQESVTVKVDTSPLPAQPASAPAVAPTIAAPAVDPSAARIAELERRLQETQARLEQTPVAAGTASGESGGPASS